MPVIVMIKNSSICCLLHCQTLMGSCVHSLCGDMVNCNHPLNNTTDKYSYKVFRKPPAES